MSDAVELPVGVDRLPSFTRWGIGARSEIFLGARLTSLKEYDLDNPKVAGLSLGDTVVDPFHGRSNAYYHSIETALRNGPYGAKYVLKGTVRWELVDADGNHVIDVDPSR